MTKDRHIDKGYDRKKVIATHSLTEFQKIPKWRLIDVIPCAYEVAELSVWSEHFKGLNIPFAITQELNLIKSPTRPGPYRYRLWKERRI